MKASKPTLEVHEHCYLAGPHANGRDYKFAHSHEGGEGPHYHDDGTSRTGPAARTIDRDAWLRVTGMRGGGRKVFTPRPTGAQLPTVPTEPSRIDVVIIGDGGASIAKGGTGGGSVTLARLCLGSDVIVGSVRHDGRRAS